MDHEPYEYPAVDKVQCPKCREIRDIAFSSGGRSLEYAGVCQSRLESGAICGAVLRLRVTAHELPAAVS